MQKVNIVLIEPQIPQNTGNIARTCAAIGAKLHLVKPFPFDISEKTLKRAGLDYWDKVEVVTHENLQEFKEILKNKENAGVMIHSCILIKFHQGWISLHMH